MFDQLYHDLILDHARRPRNRGELAPPARRLKLLNPLCGDELQLSVLVEEGRLADVKFVGHGCTISQAAGSIFAESLIGTSVEEALAVAQDYREMLNGRLPPERRESLRDLLAFEGVKRYPTRLKCALLAEEVLRKVLAG